MITNVWLKGAIVAGSIAVLAVAKYYWPSLNSNSPVEKVVDEVVLVETGVDISGNSPAPVVTPIITTTQSVTPTNKK